MRVLIALLVVGAVGTSLLAYGPKLAFLDGDSEEAAVDSVEAAAPPEDSEEAAVASVEAAAPPEDSSEATGPEAVQAVEVPAQVAQSREPAVDTSAVPAGEIIPGTDGLRRVRGTIQQSINHTLASSLDRSVADPLSQVVSRTLVWWIDPSRDLQRGDRLSILYSLPPGEEPLLHAVSLRSGKFGKTFRAFAFHPEGFEYRRIYSEDGVEVEKRLVDSPIKEYEQITSLLWDGRGHNGVDFKTPVGTESFAPFDGRVMRRNWSTRYNGNCLHIRGDNGLIVYFLHLESFAEGMEPGRRVRKGELIGLSGNTGRSYAPHLHYELRNSAGRVLDPFEVQESYRESVPVDQKPAFDAHVARLGSILEPVEAYAADR